MFKQEKSCQTKDNLFDFFYILLRTVVISLGRKFFCSTDPLPRLERLYFTDGKKIFMTFLNVVHRSLQNPPNLSGHSEPLDESTSVKPNFSSV